MKNLYTYKIIFEDGTDILQQFDNPVMLSNNETNTHQMIKTLEYVGIQQVEDAPVVESIVADVVESSFVEGELV